MEEKKNTSKAGDRKNNYIAFAIVLCIVAILAVALSLLFGKKETKISEEKEDVTMGALYCKSTHPNDAFFVSETATKGEHEVKITFRGEGADKFSYIYYGTYGTENEADHDRSAMHADYNIYMGENGVEQGSLTPTFTYNGASTKINLFAERGSSLNAVTARFFFLSGDELDKVGEYSKDDLEKLYVKKGFSCTFNE